MESLPREEKGIQWPSILGFKYLNTVDPTTCFVFMSFSRPGKATLLINGRLYVWVVRTQILGINMTWFVLNITAFVLNMA